VYRELALLASYTLEASFAGASIGTSLPQHWRSGSPVEAEPAEGGALSEDGGGGGSGGSERTGGGSSERDDSGGEGDGESRGENSSIRGRIGNGHAQGAPWTPEDGDGRGGCSGEGSVRLSSAQLPPPHHFTADELEAFGDRICVHVLGSFQPKDGSSC